MRGRRRRHRYRLVGWQRRQQRLIARGEGIGLEGHANAPCGMVATGQ